MNTTRKDVESNILYPSVCPNGKCPQAEGNIDVRSIENEGPKGIVLLYSLFFQGNNV